MLSLGRCIQGWPSKYILMFKSLTPFIKPVNYEFRADIYFLITLQMGEIADWCLSENAINRPEMREVVVALSQIRTSSTEWEASLGGDSVVFSGLFNGR